MAISIDGVEFGHLARAANDALAARIALGPSQAGPPASGGYLDIDRVTVRTAS
jgi:hypothetical protein